MFDSTNETNERDVGSLYMGDGMAGVEHLMATGELLPSQLPMQGDWSPCKKLAASVLASALVEIRDHSHDPSYKKRIDEDLDWIECGEDEWSFSFLRICDLLDLNPDWVKMKVYHWLMVPPSERTKPVTPYRQAA